MENGFKRFLSLALAIIMVLSNVPVSAFASEVADCPHTSVQINTSATCTTDGETITTCLTCNEVISTVEALASGHNYVDGVCACGEMESVEIEEEEAPQFLAEEEAVTADAVAEVATYEDLVAALANGGEIKLTDDITVDTRITVIDGTVIDLNGKTLSINVENSTYGNATIKNGNIVLGKDDVHVCDGYFLVNEGKTLVLDGVNMTSAEGGIKGYAVFHLKTGANLDLINSTIAISDNEYAAGYIVYAGEATATVDMNGTTITGSNVNGIVHATTVIDNSTFTITDAVEHGINRSGVTINDSKVAISGGTGRGITAQHGDLVITGNSTVTITDMGEATIELRGDKNLTVAETATVKVDKAVNNTTTGTVTGSVTVDTTIGAVAVIGNQGYKTLEEAFAAAVEGDTIVLGADATPVLKSQSAITKASVIDLGGKTLTLTEDDLYFGTTTFKNGTIVVDPSVKASTAVFWMFENQTLTFDNVDIVATGVTGTYLIGINGGTGTAVNLIESSITIDNQDQAALSAVICDNGTGNNIVIEDSEINVAKIEGRFYLGGAAGSITVKDSAVALNGVKEGFRLRANQNLSIAGNSNVAIVLNSNDGRFGINLEDETATYTKEDTATVTASDNKPIPPVAKVGNVEYGSIDEAIANWTNGTTLTLLADVTLSDVIKLSSTEYHILDLGTYTMTAASRKDAIQIVNNGRTSASYALDIKADATNPGGITATGKAVVRHSGSAKDRPITRFYGGVFNASYIVYHSGNNGSNSPSFYFYGGEFNGTIYTNRSTNIFYGGTFTGSLQMSVDSSAYALIAGGTFKQLSNLYGSFLNSGKFTIGSAKGVYDRVVYVDDNGNYVVATAAPAEGFEAAVEKKPGTNDYLAYSKVATEGVLNYTDATLALKNNTSATVTVHADEVDLAGINFKGTIVVPDDSTLTITNAPANLKVVDENGKALTPNANGTYTTVAPTGSITPGYTATTGVWGEGGGNAFTSLEIQLYAGDTKIASAKLNNIGGIFDGDVYVTWYIPFAGSNDEYWTVEWAEGHPTKYVKPTTVKMIIDGVEVAHNSVQMNGPDGLNPVEWEKLEATQPDVAMIGTKGYKTLADAVKAIATDGSDTTIKLLTDVELDSSVEFNYGTGKVTFTADEPVTVKQTKVGLNLGFRVAQAANIVVDENVTFEIYDNDSGMYVYYGPSLTVNGAITGGQNWGCLYLFNGEHLVSETGKVAVGRIQAGFTNLTVNGEVDTNYLLVEGATFTADGAIVDANVIFDNNNGVQRRGASQFVIKNGSNVNTNKLTLSYADSTLTIDTSSSLKAAEILGKGKIIIDGANFAGNEWIIEGDASKFEGTVEIINNPDLKYEITASGIVVKAKAYVAKIGDVKFESVADALAYAKAQSMTDVVIILIGETNSATTDSFDMVYTTLFDSVTFKQEDATKTYYLCDLYTGARTNNGRFVFDGVNITVTEQYMFEGNVELINNSKITSTAEANCFVYYANVVVNAGSSIKGVIEDIRGGTLTIDGGKTDGTYTETPGLQDAILAVNWKDSKLVLKNGAYVKVNAANEVGRLTVNGTLEVSDSKLDSYQWIAINDGATLTVNSNSIITTQKITGPGKIIIDAAGMTAGEFEGIAADLSGFTGNVEVINNPNVYAEIVNGKIVLAGNVAKIGEQGYATLGAALAAAKDGETITLIWAEGNAPIAMNGSVFGKTVTITGTATVDWSKGFLFVGRGGEGNGTVIFDNAVLTSASNNASTGIHVSGREKNTSNKYDGTLVIKNSTIELDYLINKGAITLDNATLTVKNGFAIGGRPASETENGEDATATLSLTNGSKVVVNNHNGMGLGYEAIGVMNIDATSTFETTQAFRVTAKGAMNIAGKAEIVGGLTNNGSIVLTAVNAELTANECGGVTSALRDYKVAYTDGAYKLVNKTYVAQIDAENKFETLAEAIAAVQNGQTITLLKDITENVTLTEKTGLYYTIDGNGNKMNGTISISSLSDTNDNRRITIKNINFVDTTDANVDFISSVNTNHYPRITVEGCTFTGSGNDGDVAIRLKSSHSVIIKDCAGTGLHSFMQNTSGWNLTIENVTVTDSKSGLALGTVQGVTVKGCNIDVAGYGIRMDAQYNNNAVIDSNTVKAFIPVVVRKASVDSTVTVQGSNTMTATNTDGIWFAIGTSEYEANGSMPTAATAKVIVDLKDTGLKADGIYGNYYVAIIGNAMYQDLAAAFAAAKDGDIVEIHQPGTYKLGVSGKNITVTGVVDGVVFDNIGAYGMNGASVTFNNVTFNYAANSTYKGLQHAGDLVYNDCIFNGQVFLYGASETFNDCTFNTTDSNNYNVWTYGAKEVTFNDCTFNSAGKSVLIYAESESVTNNIIVKDSTFNASTAVEGKAAIEMDSSLTSGITLTVTNSTATGFGTGNVSGNSLWNNKKGNNTDANNDITVVVNGETVLEPVTFVAYIGKIGYTKIDDAIKAAAIGDTVIIKAGTYNQNLTINKAITVVGEIDEAATVAEETKPGVQHTNLVAFNGQLAIKASGVTVKNLNFTNSTGKACQINAKDVLIENCELKGSNGLYQSYTSGTVTFKDSTITGGTYGIHFEGSANGNVVIDNCIVTGWNSFAKVISKITIKDTEFAKGNYNKLRLYQNAELTNVTFNSAMSVDFGTSDLSVAFDNCTVEGNAPLTSVLAMSAINGKNIDVTIDGNPVIVEATIATNGKTTYYASLAEAIAAAKAGDTIVLDKDVIMSYGAREAYGAEDLATLTIDGNGYVLTLNQTNSDWSSIGLKNAEGKLVLKNMTIEKTGKGDTSGAWNTHAIIFSTPVEMNNVTVNNAIAVAADATLNNVTINEANGYYGLWIEANGQTVTVNGGSITATNGGRGIKIADQYIDAPASVTLKVDGTVFNTAKKAAVLVSSVAGAEITATNVNIENVAEDDDNFAWVDEDWAADFGKVTVNGAPATQEGIENFYVAIVDANDNVIGYYADITTAVNDCTEAGNYTIKMLADFDKDVTILQQAGINITIDGDNKAFTGTINIHGNSNYGSETLTIKNVQFETTEAKHDFIWSDSQTAPARYAHNVTIENCYFSAMGAAKNSAVALRIRQAQNIQVIDCSAYGLHSVIQATGCAGEGIIVEGLNAISCKNGISVGTSNLKISDSYIATTGADSYGIRANAEGEYTVNVEDCSIKAYIPVLIRNTTAEGFTLNVEGNNSLKATNKDGYLAVFSAGDVDADHAPTEPNVGFNLSGLDRMKVFPQILEGSGSKTDPYLIHDVAELILFRDSVNAGSTKYNAEGIYVALAGDIDLAGIDWSVNIGDDCNATFDGIFDGKGHTISNLTSTETAQKGDGYICTGLFGAIYGNAVIKNLTIDGANINTGDFTGNNAAVVVGFGYNATGSIENVKVVNSTINAAKVDGVGAIVGYAYIGKLTVKGCSVENTNIIGQAYVGGIMGYADCRTVITDCTVKDCEINATSCAAGGVAGILLAGGKINNATITDVALTTAHENWKNSAAAAVGCTTGTITVDAKAENVTANGANASIVGSEHLNKPTAPVAKVAAKIGNTYYLTFAEALASTQSDEVILLTPIVVAAGESVVIDLNGKTITGTDTATGSFALITNRGELTITGNGKITLEATNNRGWNAYSSVISNTVGGKLTVESGVIEHLGGTDMAYGIDNLTNGKGTYAETIINGGTVKSTYRAIRQFLNGVEAQNILTVNGGTIEGANKSIWMQDPSKNANTGKLTVSENATLNGDVYLFVTAGSTEWPVEVSIAAAALSDTASVVSGNVPEGYIVAETKGAWSVMNGKVAKINDTYYDSFDAAYTAAQKGDTIELLQTAVITKTKAWINYSKKNITVKAAFGETAFRVQDGAYVWFGGMTIESDDYCIIVGASDSSSGATVEIYGGTYKGATTAISVTKGDVKIMDGTFSVEPYEGSYEYTINCVDAAYKNGDADVSIQGGKFYNFNPANNAAEGAGTNFLVGGYCTKNDNGTYVVGKQNYEGVYTEPTLYADGFTTYTCSFCGDHYDVVSENTKLEPVAVIGDVQYASLSDAVKAAQNGDVVMVIADHEIPCDVTPLVNVIGKDITIDLNGKTITANAVGAATVVRVVFQAEADAKLTMIDSVGGGSVIANGEGVIYYMFRNVGEMTIKGGNYELSAFNGGAMFFSMNGNMTVYGGTFTQTTTGWMFNTDLNGVYRITVYGGTFNRYFIGGAAHGENAWGEVVLADGLTLDEIQIDGDTYWTIAESVAKRVDANGEDIATYASLAEALAVVENGETIVLLKDCAENVTINQVSGKSFTIDGDNHKYTGTISINGNKRSTGKETLTFKNINFVIEKNTGSGIFAQKDTYAHNIIVDGCTFTGNNNVPYTYGIHLRGAYNVTVKNTTGTKLLDLIYAQNMVYNLVVENVKVSHSTNGVWAPYGINATFTNVDLNVSQHGVYVGNRNACTVTFNGVKIKSEIPVVLEQQDGVTKAVTLIFKGESQFISTIENATWLEVIGTDATFKAVIEDAGLDMNKTSGLAVKVGENVYYNTLTNAIKAGADDDVIVLADSVLATYWAPVKNLIVNEDATLTVKSGVTLSIASEMVVNGTLIDEGASYVLTAADATIKAQEDLNVSTTVAGKKVVYEDGIHKVADLIYVAEVNGEKYEKLSEAIKAAKAGNTVKLLADVEENVTVNKNLTIDGGNFKYTGQISITGATSVTVQNLNVISGNIYKDKNSGSVTVKDCLFDGKGLNKYALDLRCTNSNITVEHVTVKNYGYGFLQISTGGCKQLTVKDVVIDNVNYGIKVDYANAVALDNVTMDNVKYFGIWNSNYGTKTITIKDSHIDAAIDNNNRTDYTNVQTYKFVGENTVSKLPESDFAKVVLADTNAVLITPETDKVDIVSGVDGYKVIYETVAYKLAKKDYVAQIGEKKFESLAEAFADAQDGDTIVMIADHVMDGSKVVNDTTWVYDNLIVSGKAITLDFAGYTVEVTPDFTATDDGGVKNTLESIIFIEKGGSLTLKDETGKGGFHVKAGTNLYSMIYNSGSTLVIESGNYFVEKTITAGSIIYADKNHTTTINGGVFTLVNAGEDSGSTKPWIFNAEGKNASFAKITGGYFNDNPYKNHGTAKDCEVEIADDKCFVKITEGEFAGYWTLNGAVAYNVQKGINYATVTDALNAATSGETVKMLKASEADILMVPAGVKLDLNGQMLTVNYAIVSFGHVIDSTDGNGGIAISSDAAVGRTSLLANNEYFPIYDSAKGCYRFFSTSNEFIVARGNPKGDTTEHKVTFAFTMYFKNIKAYELLAASDHGIDMNVYIGRTTTDGTEEGVPAAYRISDATVKSFAERAIGQIQTSGKVTAVITLAVKGLQIMPAGTKVTAYATITANGTGVTTRTTNTDSYPIPATK